MPTPTHGGTTGAPATYTGRAVTMRYGTVQVQVTVRDGAVLDAKALKAPNDNPTSVSVNTMAVPKLNKEAIAAGSAKIDSVSGATYTSSAYKESLQSAIDQRHG